MNVYERTRKDGTSLGLYARFEYRGKKYLHSLRTNDEALAKKRAKRFRDEVIDATDDLEPARPKAVVRIPKGRTVYYARFTYMKRKFFKSLETNVKAAAEARARLFVNEVVKQYHVPKQEMKKVLRDRLTLVRQLPPELYEAWPTLEVLRAKNEPCIYFLILSDEVVYVGMTVSLIPRLAAHVRLKHFDYVCYYHCREEELVTEEARWIARLHPRFNGSPELAWIEKGTKMPFPKPRGRGGQRRVPPFAISMTDFNSDNSTQQHDTTA